MDSRNGGPRAAVGDYPVYDTQFRERALRLVRGLPPHSGLRPAALAAVGGRPLAAEQFDQALDATNIHLDVQWRERAVGTWVLATAELTDEQHSRAVEALARALRNGAAVRTANARRRITSGLYRSLAIGLATFMALAVGYTTSSGDLDALYGIPVARGSFDRLVLVSFLLSLLPHLRQTLGERHGARTAGEMTRWALGRLGAVQAVALLARDAVTSPTALQSLLRVLPSITEADQGALGGDATPALCRLLGRRLNADAAVGILRALGSAGDGRAVEAVERLAATAGADHVRREAERILPILRERREREQDAGRLVRATATPDSGAATLVRPARDGGQEAQALLRASEGDGR